MSESSRPSSNAWETVLDSVTALLFASFVVFLFVGYLGLYPSVPSTALAAVALLGSLAVLAFANGRADRRMAQSSPTSPS